MLTPSLISPLVLPRALVSPSTPRTRSSTPLWTDAVAASMLGLGTPLLDSAPCSSSAGWWVGTYSGETSITIFGMKPSPSGITADQPNEALPSSANGRNAREIHWVW